MLANEQVVDGCCWRHEDTMVEQRDLTQWFLRITKYADELLSRVWTSWRAGRRRSGRCSGTGSGGAKARWSSLRRRVCRGQRRSEPTKITVFTTRVDTIFGATSVQLAPEHRGGEGLCGGGCGAGGCRLRRCWRSRRRRGRRATLGAIEKHGVATGRFAVNPFNGERVPIWVANYILADYGTGAIMSVPAHDERDFEFATKYGLPVKRVIAPDVSERRER